MVKKINPWDNSGDEDGWSLGGEMFKKSKIVDFSKIANMQGSKNNFGGYLKGVLLLLALIWLGFGVIGAGVLPGRTRRDFTFWPLCWHHRRWFALSFAVSD